jgi:hypothetical protein
MKPTKRIPIKAAKEFAKAQGLDQVIVLGYSRANNLTHVTTYGRTVEDCSQAAMGGNAIKKEILNWPDALCRSAPPRAKRKGAKTLQQYLKERPKSEKFVPGAVQFVPEGDLVNCFIYDEPCYAECLNNQVTIYRSNADGEVVGFSVKGITEIINGNHAAL